MDMGIATIFSIAKDNNLFAESLNWYIGYLRFICEGLGYGKRNIISDIRLLYNMLANVFGNIGKVGNEGMQSLCYGAAMYICAFTEKILRITYRYMKEDEEYISNTITMGECLSEGNEVIKEMLGEYQIKHLLFYFGEYPKRE